MKSLPTITVLISSLVDWDSSMTCHWWLIGNKLVNRALEEAQLQATSSSSWNYRKSQNPKPPTLQPFSTLLALASKDSFPSYRTPPKTFLESTVVLPKPQKFMGNVGSEVQRYMTVKLGRCNIRRPKYKQNTQRNTLPWRDSNDAM